MGFVSAWLVHRREPFWIEVVSGFASLSWGAFSAWLAPASLDDQAIYDVLTQYIPAAYWCAAAMLLGAVQIACAVWELRRIRQIGALTMVLFWSLLDVALLKADAIPNSAPLYLAFALGNLPTFWLLQTRAQPVTGG